MTSLSEFENFWIDPATGLMVVDQAGNVLGVSGFNRIGQQCNQAIRPQKGTVPLDSEAGVDWLGLAFNSPNEPALRADIAEQLLGVPGVARITSITITREPNPEGGEILTAEYEVETDSGVPVGGQVVVP